MIRRSTWIVLGVFVAVAALAFFWDDIPALNPPQATPTPVADVPVLFDFSIDQVSRLELRDNLGNRAIYERDSDSLWYTDALPDDGEAQLDSAMMVQTVAQLTYWRALATIDSITELEAVGLVSPQTRITIELVNGEEIQVAIGDVTVTGSGYYVKVDGQQPQVVSLASVDQVVELLYSPPLVQATPTSQP